MSYVNVPLIWGYIYRYTPRRYAPGNQSDHSRTCLPNLVNFGPQTEKNSTGVSTHSKLTFSDAHISGAKGCVRLKISKLVQDDERLLTDTSLGMDLPPTVFKGKNSKIGKKSGVLWLLSSGSVGRIAPNVSIRDVSS